MKHPLSAFTKWLGMVIWALPGGAALAVLDTGAAIPAVTAPDHDGKPVALNEIGASGYLLVYFYPKADTPGCTKQACSLRDAYEELTAQGVRVIGVSMDKPGAQQAFRTKFNLPFTLLADESGAVVSAFGVPKMGSFAKRQAFLFRDGKLIWKDESASTQEQAKDVLAVLRVQP